MAGLDRGSCWKLDGRQYIQCYFVYHRFGHHPTLTTGELIIRNMLTLRPSTTKPLAYGYIFLFAYLALFVAFIFLANGGWRSYEQYVENTKWLPAEAQVTGSSVDFTYGYDGKIYGKKYRARCLLRCEVNGVAYDTEKFAGSIVFVSNKQIELTRPKVTIAMLRDWTRAHSRGTSLTIHYDPSDPHQISNGQLLCRSIFLQASVGAKVKDCSSSALLCFWLECFSESALRLRELLAHALFRDALLHGIRNHREYREVENKIHGNRYVKKSADRRGERPGPVRKYVGSDPHPRGDHVQQGSWEFLSVADREPQREKSRWQGHHRRKNHANQDISQHWV
jgi:hypothetical protein